MAFQSAKQTGDSSTGGGRETTLQNLENAYNPPGLGHGSDVLQQSGGIVSRFRDDCRNFVYTRRTEAQHMEADVSDAMAGLQLQQQHSENLLARNQAQGQTQQQHQHRYPQPNHQTYHQQTPPQTRMMQHEPLQAPMPQRPQQQQRPPVTSVERALWLFPWRRSIRRGRRVCPSYSVGRLGQGRKRTGCRCRRRSRWMDCGILRRV
ncbi:pH-response regulator protein palA/rim20 [Friedmanniomyces endolithicus]|nr:pH-response regulator protein palA/rim20 [Friedmanniomyces endolithicus]KAK0822866.1 pH-response regulator protein palA/rim20 [Friedmanniomyces endolithicus]